MASSLLRATPAREPIAFIKAMKARCFVKCDKNSIETTYDFQDKFAEDIEGNLDSINAKLYTFERFKYIQSISSGVIAPTHEGLRYKEARLIYWRHRVIIPATVSFLTALATSSAFKIVSGL
jgi:hypothetical protein